jgi:GntR family transcriptional repressor for pyruvate dehydrogenase complex
LDHFTTLVQRRPPIFNRTRLIQGIVEELRDRIIRGELSEGERLPHQERLAQSMGVSRGTLREALNQLVLMGIIEMKQGSGTYIRAITPSSYMTSLSSALLMDKASAMELLDARLYIEGAVSALAAKKATDEHIRELKRILEAMKVNILKGDLGNTVNQDFEFHLLVAKSCQNRVLMKVVETIRDTLYQFIAGTFSTLPETVHEAMEYHYRIYRAIERHDPVEARTQMESHINSLIVRLNEAELKTASHGP